MPNNIVKSVAKDKGVSVPEVEKIWEKAKSQAEKEFEDKGKKTKTVSFWKYVTSIFKSMAHVD